MATDPLSAVRDDDPYYWEESWSEYDTAYEDYEDTGWDDEVGYQWSTR
jgi:hypothetical protein